MKWQARNMDNGNASYLHQRKFARFTTSQKTSSIHFYNAAPHWREL